MISRLTNTQPAPQQSSVPAKASANKTQQKTFTTSDFSARGPLPKTPVEISASSHLFESPTVNPNVPKGQSPFFATAGKTDEIKMSQEQKHADLIFELSSFLHQKVKRDTHTSDTADPDKRDDPKEGYTMNWAKVDELFSSSENNKSRESGVWGGHLKQWENDNVSLPKYSF